MSANSKLNALLAAQSAQNDVIAGIAAKVSTLTGGSSSDDSAALAALQNSVAVLQAEIGTDTDGQGPIGGPAPAIDPNA